MQIMNAKILLLSGAILLASCEKLVLVEDPIDTITSNQLFISDEQAKNAMAGIYSIMINDKGGAGDVMAQFSNGMVTILGGLSADELIVTSANYSTLYSFNTNKLFAESKEANTFWTTAYNAIYGANAVVEGIAASSSSLLTEKVREKYTGEARFIRAFSYFYLTNFFGDLPLAISIDFNKTKNVPRSSQAIIYKQIINDLLAAKADLPPVNTNQSGERIYPDKWAATALLARAYLYTGEYEKAFKEASAVIGNATQFSLETDLSKVFLKESKEAIWQLKQNSQAGWAGSVGTATAEGYGLIPVLTGSNSYSVSYNLPNILLNAFEPGDKRFTNWVGSVDVDYTIPAQTYYYPYKYKTGSSNRVPNGIPTEFYVMLRLAEQYLIRAEAAAHGAASISDAIDDLNVLRKRADLTDLPYTLTQPQVLEAIAQERRIELFDEWGHRWLDLKRTGKAPGLLSQLPLKKPWTGDYQLLYPIPPYEIKTNPKLIPNPGYF